MALSPGNGHRTSRLYYHACSLTLPAIAGPSYKMATKDFSYVPPSTIGHAAVAIRDKLYRWGGKRSGLRSDLVDVFDVSKQQWECLTTCGPPPPGIDSCAYTAIGTSLFTFGGEDGDYYRYNSLHQLDTMTLEWRELVPRSLSHIPRKKMGCGMVSLDEDKLVVFAGFTERGKRTNELHVFNTKKSECL